MQERLPAAARLEVQAILPAEGAQALDDWLHANHRALTGTQRQGILQKFQQGGGLPLYLKLAFDEARRWRSFDGFPDSGADIPAILNDLFNRLEQESQHGKVMLARALGYLAAAKNGLGEDELLDILWADPTLRSDFFRRSPKSPRQIAALPVVVWSRLYLDLEPYLAWRQADGMELLGFYHRQLREAVEARYCGADEKPALHRSLAAYFGNPAHPFWLDAQHTRPDQRKTAELAFQQAYAGLADELTGTLTTFDFLHARLTAAGVEELIGDYDLLLKPIATAPFGAHPSNPAVEDAGLAIIQESLHLSAHVLEKDPDQLPAQLFSRLPGFAQPSVRRLLDGALAFQARPWLRPLTPLTTGLPGGVEQRTIFASSGPDVAISPDGRLGICGAKVWDLETGREKFRLYKSGKFVVTPSGQLLIVGERNNIFSHNVWSVETGQVLHELNPAFFPFAFTPNGQMLSYMFDRSLRLTDLETGKYEKMHAVTTREVDFAAITPDGHWALSGLKNKILKLWDLRSGRLKYELKGHKENLVAAQISADGSLAVSASYSEENGVIVWDLQRGRAIATLPGFINGRPLAITPDGKYLAVGSRQIRIYDLKTPRELLTLTGHTERVASMAITPDGHRLISCADDGILKIWNLDAGNQAGSASGHTGLVKKVIVSPDGKTVISASEDKSLKIWALDTCQEKMTLAGHQGKITDAALTSDGKLVVSSSLDKSLKVWDLQTGKERFTLKAHLGAVTCVAVHGSDLAVSGSEDHTLNVWDLRSGRKMRCLRGHADSVNAIALTRMGAWRYLGVAPIRTIKILSVRVWELSTGR